MLSPKHQEEAGEAGHWEAEGERHRPAAAEEHHPHIAESVHSGYQEVQGVPQEGLPVGQEAVPFLGPHHRSQNSQDSRHS